MTRATLTALLALLLCGLSSAGARDEQPSEIKAIMLKVNKPGGGHYSIIVQELKAEDTDWGEVNRNAQELKRLVDMLPKAKPPKGDADSWARLTKAYGVEANALLEAAKKKNKPAAQAAVNRMGEAACMNCHKMHRKD
jgi:cytochrome c556